MGEFLTCIQTETTKHWNIITLLYKKRQNNITKQCITRQYSHKTLLAQMFPVPQMSKFTIIYEWKDKFIMFYTHKNQWIYIHNQLYNWSTVNSKAQITVAKYFWHYSFEHLSLKFGIITLTSPKGHKDFLQLPSIS